MICQRYCHDFVREISMILSKILPGFVKDIAMILTPFPNVISGFSAVPFPSRCLSNGQLYIAQSNGCEFIGYISDLIHHIIITLSNHFIHHFGRGGPAGWLKIQHRHNFFWTTPLYSSLLNNVILHSSNRETLKSITGGSHKKGQQ